eukprot:SAG31_NODE_25938_length_451_cov_0.866477_1_plen_83_part_00
MLLVGVPSRYLRVHTPYNNLTAQPATCSRRSPNLLNLVRVDLFGLPVDLSGVELNLDLLSKIYWYLNLGRSKFNSRNTAVPS